MSSGCCALLGMAEPTLSGLMFAMVVCICCVLLVDYGVGYRWCGLLRGSDNFLGCNTGIEDDVE